VDDNQEELQKLVTALHGVGAPCLPLHYDQVRGINEQQMKGVRILFLDLHLTTGTGTAADVRQSAAIIIGILEAGIDPLAGPYVIVLWTSHAEQKELFDQYLRENLRADVHPIAVLSLNKNDYLGGDAGPKLLADVQQVVEADPRLKALLHWEREVLRAAGATMGEIGALVSEEDRRAAQFSSRLDEILSLLAFEAVGATAARADPFSAVNAVLLPILSDRVANLRTQPDTTAIWLGAVTRIGETPEPTLNEAAKLNAMLHIATPEAEELTSAAWGAVTVLPDADLADDVMRGRFNLVSRPLLNDLFCVREKADRRNSALCVVRIGANCDYAQNRVGPIPFLLGAIVPATAPRREEGITDAEFRTPPVMVPGRDGPVRIFVNTRLQISLVPSDLVNWQPAFRIREQLLLQLTAHEANYSTRPAIVSFGRNA
jgi:hypothetical protein